MDRRLLCQRSLRDVFLLLGSVRRLVLNTNGLLRLDLCYLRIAALLRTSLRIERRALLARRITHGNGKDSSVVLIMFQLLSNRRRAQEVRQVGRRTNVQVRRVRLSLLLQDVGLRGAVPFYPSARNLYRASARNSVLRVNDVRQRATVAVGSIISV